MIRNIITQNTALMKNNRNKDDFELSPLLEQFKHKYRLNAKLDAVEIEKLWHQELGQGVSNYTDKVEFKRTTLYVWLTSSVIREELSYGKTRIIEMLNTKLGKEVVKKIVFY